MLTARTIKHFARWFIRFASSQANFDTEAFVHNGSALRVFHMRKERTRNALCFELFDQLDRFVKEAANDRQCKAVVLKSDVKGVFCAGGDLKERATMKDNEVINFLDNARRILCELESLPMPVMVAIDGHALGGGLELALACDIRIAANNVRMGLIETKIGVMPGIGGTQRLVRLINPSIAKELIFTGRTVDAIEAHHIGLVNYAVHQNRSMDAAYVRTLQIIDEMASGAPMSIRMSKEAIMNGQQVDLKTGLAIEAQCYSKIIPLRDRIEGLLAFKEKRKPIFKGQ
ncbi:methylglutaconyl coenzyme A hydratase [Trichuris trichiura]|uniref:Methylglutaconyl coenzyme A hydratase n=1 Tax=Trichuris trichiura TaxID=36087 RepID=A0A077Z8Q8_TRITR|nr:methylglutaconyl coenzyme A hydratase [Trichuris trichiura]